MTGGQKLFVRAGAVAAGVTFALAVIGFTVYWWVQRPKPWTEKALTGQYSQLLFQQVGEGIQVTFAYALTSSTDEDYILPNSETGALMRRNPDDGSLVKLDGATWPIFTIPAKQKIEVRFTVPYKFADYNTSAEELSGKPEVLLEKGAEPSQRVLGFVGRRMKEIDGLVFFDFSKRYKVLLPEKWREKDDKTGSKTPTTATPAH